MYKKVEFINKSDTDDKILTIAKSDLVKIPISDLVQRSGFEFRDIGICLPTPQYGCTYHIVADSNAQLVLILVKNAIS